MVRKSKEIYEKLRLQVNMDKSEFLTVGNGTVSSLPLQIGQLERKIQIIMRVVAKKTHYMHNE